MCVKLKSVRLKRKKKNNFSMRSSSGVCNTYIYIFGFEMPVDDQMKTKNKEIV